MAGTGRKRGDCYPMKVGIARPVLELEVRTYCRQIARLIRDAMAERDLPARELYRACGVHPVSISRILKGRRMVISVGTIVRLARAMDMQPSELLP